MSRRPKYPRGLSWSRAGWRISLGAHGAAGRKRLPPATPQVEAEAVLLRMRSRIAAGRLSHRQGSLSADVVRYLTDHFTGRTAYAEQQRLLGLWTAALGPDVSRNVVTKDEIARILNHWRQSGLAADTCNKRRAALASFYTVLNGRGGYNPVRDVPKFRPPDPLPRGVPYDILEKALAILPRSATRARLSVMAYTGARPGQIMRLNPDDHWDRRLEQLTIPGTAKGRGTKTYTIPLSPAATAALKEMDVQEAWGTFTWAPMARMWRAAWLAVHVGKSFREVADHPERYAQHSAPVPYDLRHSFGTEIYRQTGDLKAVKELLGHSAIRMSERYTLAAVPTRQRAAMTVAFGGRKLSLAEPSRRKNGRK